MITVAHLTTFANALGSPLAEHFWGGRAELPLSGGMRLASLVAGAVLLVMLRVVTNASGLTDPELLPQRWPHRHRPATARQRGATMPTTTTTAHMRTREPAPPPDVVVAVDGLTKRYDGATVVDDVSFTVHEGEVLGILGPNGAGKTTTVESIAGLRTPDLGRVAVLGADPSRDRDRVRAVLGVQLQESRFQDRLTVREVVDTFAGLYPDAVDTTELLDRLGLGAAADTRYARLSGGQQQRVSIAVALVGRPRVVILDELTTGLDPQARRDTWRLVEDLRDGGVTILLVTHFMEEAERLADRVALIDHGRLVALDTPHGLVERAGMQQRLRFTTPSRIDPDWLTRLAEVTAVDRRDDEFVVTGDDRMLFAVVSLLATHDIVPDRLHVEQPTLDDAFVALTGRSLTARPSTETTITQEVAR